MGLRELFQASKEYEESRRWDNVPDKVVYYADGKYFNESLFIWQKDPVWGGCSWVQSGYRTVEQLKRHGDFQCRLEM
ncbi:MAG: hypothetical protein GOVbin4162_130 [Prokaryotic dsDNA virus sp.]|nr:MAG: hypothetical protein GOVbin4162_130 [Prokaryotic dsDNA virus sp.]|tara:strand:- start:9924 stop:10154 length:231 start_codon:yes stop_codon:yes gene_type:complete